MRRTRFSVLLYAVLGAFTLISSPVSGLARLDYDSPGTEWRVDAAVGVSALRAVENAPSAATKPTRLVVVGRIARGDWRTHTELGLAFSPGGSVEGAQVAWLPPNRTRYARHSRSGDPPA